MKRGKIPVAQERSEISMTREGIKKVIDEEGLRGYNFFENRANAEDEMVIVNDSKQWIVYATDERASKMSGSEKRFDNEVEALENYLTRLRALNSLKK